MGIDTAISAPSSGCYDLSDTYIVVFRDSASVCEVSIEDGLVFANFRLNPNPTRTLMRISFLAEAPQSNQTRYGVYHQADQVLCQGIFLTYQGLTIAFEREVADLPAG